MRRRPAMPAGALALALAFCTSTADPPEPTPTPATTPTAPSPSPTSGVVRFAAIGDIGDGSSRAASVARAIAREHDRRRLDLLLLLGDIIYPRGKPQDYRRAFARPYRRVLRRDIPIRASLGNHDIQSNTAAVMKLFDMPASYYTFTEGPVQFFALDTSRRRVDAEQRTWLEKELSESSARWKVAFGHVPLYSSGEYGTNDNLVRALAPLFERYDVALVLAGHNHNYERTKPIRGVTYVMSGGGCCPRPRPGGFASFTAAAESRLGFVVIEASEDALRLTALGEDGTVFDRASIRPRGRAGS